MTDARLEPKDRPALSARPLLFPPSYTYTTLRSSFIVPFLVRLCRKERGGIDAIDYVTSMHTPLTGTLGTIVSFLSVHSTPLVDAKKESLIIDHRQRNENCLSRIKGPIDTAKNRKVFIPLFTTAVLWDLFVYLSRILFPLSNGLLCARLGTIHSLEAGTVLSFFHFICEAPWPRFPPSIIMRPKNDDD